MPITSSVPKANDPAVCDAYDELARQFGKAVAQWGIAFEHDSKFDDVVVNQAVFVWRDRVAVERVGPAARIAQTCYPARVETNFRVNLRRSPAKLQSVSSEERHVADSSRAAGTGVRVKAILREAGVDMPVYYDFLYVAYERMTTTLEVRRAVEPPSQHFEARLVRIVTDHLRGLQ
jgi:hypothetical protein